MFALPVFLYVPVLLPKEIQREKENSKKKNMLAWLLAILAVALFLYVYLTTLRVPALALEGAHVIVTGGSSGIGLELGIELAKRGLSMSLLLPRARF